MSAANNTSKAGQVEGEVEGFRLIDKRGLLFRPFAGRPGSTGLSLAAGSDLVDDAQLLPEQEQAIVLSGRLLSIIQTNTVPLPVAARALAKRRAGKGFALWALLFAAVLLVYLFTPLTATLVPLLPTNWSRVIVAAQILFLAEIVIFCILRRTTRASSQQKSGQKETKG